MPKRINRRHHVIPSSRGGSNSEWNLCYFRINSETSTVYIDFNTTSLRGSELDTHIFLHTTVFHAALFTNSLPSEIVQTIIKWTKGDGSLNRIFFPEGGKRIDAWTKLFGEQATVNTKIALDWLKNNGFIVVEERWQKNKIPKPRRCRNKTEE